MAAQLVATKYTVNVKFKNVKPYGKNTSDKFNITTSNQTKICGPTQHINIVSHSATCFCLHNIIRHFF
jgi:hypothetical protein